MEPLTENYIYDQQRAKEISDTIIHQMGGIGRLKAMLGAKNFSYSRNGYTTFQFAMCKKASHCRITYLEGKDLYMMEFIKVSRNYESKTVETFDDLYADQLIPIFKRFTGLDMSL
jgi:hypothetical protein